MVRKIAPLAEPAIEAVQDGRIKFVPEQYSNMYMAWMRDIQDWCISRQLWWGHRIPAWYDADGNIYVGRSEEEVRAKITSRPMLSLNKTKTYLIHGSHLHFDILNFRLPEQTPELKTFHPTDVLVTGFDIIFFWVARMIMMTMHFMKMKMVHLKFHLRRFTFTAWYVMVKVKNVEV